MSRSGMSLSEAKQELRLRGFRDPAKNPMYRTVVTTEHPPRSKSPILNDATPTVSKEYGREDSNISETRISPDVEIRNSFSALAVDEDEMEATEEDDTPKESQVKSPKIWADQKHKPDSKKPKPNMQKTGPVPSTSKAKNEKPKENLQEPNPTPQHLDNAKPSGHFVTPPQQKKSFKVSSIPTATPQPKRPLSREASEMEEISPSPVFTPRSKPLLKKPCDDKTYGNADPHSCPPSTSKDHHDRCGCHFCFEAFSRKEGSLTKEKLVEIVRNFMSTREREPA